MIGIECREKCTDCPAFEGMSGLTRCAIVNAVLNTEKAREAAYKAKDRAFRSMESYWNMKCDKERNVNIIS